MIVEQTGNHLTIVSPADCVASSEDETQLHIVNCPIVRKDNPLVDMTRIFQSDFSGGDEDVLELCRRVDEFNSLVNGDDDSENISMIGE